MGKIENWSRRQSAEGGDLAYYWQNDKTDSEVLVEYRRGTYKITYYGPNQRPEKNEAPKEIIGSNPVKRKARKRAVQWMENHPYGRLG